MAVAHARGPESRRERRQRRHRRNVVLLGGLAVLVAAVLGATWWLGNTRDGKPVAAPPTAAAACARDPLTVAVSPELETVARAALEAATTADRCHRYQVTASTPAAVVDDLRTGPGPDLWLADSSSWLDVLPDQVAKAHEVVRSVATSPVVLAAPVASTPAPPASWTELFTVKGLFRVANPDVDAASRLAFYAARSGQPPTLDASSASRLVLTSRFAETSTEALLTDPAAVATKGMFPIGEQSLATWAGKHPGTLRPLTPAGGTATLDYPLIARTDLGAGGEALVTAAAAALTTSPVQSALATAGFRTQDRTGGPTIEGVAPTGYTDIALGSGEARTAALEQWDILRRDMSMLAVLDVSGSMKELAPGSELTRWQVMEQASVNALGLLPDGAKIGAWLFSTQKGGPDQDWREMAPVQRLDALEGSRTHRQVLLDTLPTIESELSGDTALYDTTLAAFKAMTSGYEGAYVNSVVVMTDGRNDNPRGGLDLPGLLAELAAAKDPAKPVRIITIGMGEADPSALQQISAATGGTSYIANTPQDIERILVEALLARRVAPS